MKAFSSKTLQTIYLQGILPSVLYGIQVWGSCESNLTLDLEKLHLRATRFVKRISKKVPDCEVLRIAKWNNLLHYYKRSVAVKAYQIYNKTTPPQLHRPSQTKNRKSNQKYLWCRASFFPLQTLQIFVFL